MTRRLPRKHCQGCDGFSEQEKRDPIPTKGLSLLTRVKRLISQREFSLFEYILTTRHVFTPFSSQRCSECCGRGGGGG